MTIYTDDFGSAPSVVRAQTSNEALRLVNESAFANVLRLPRTTAARRDVFRRRCRPETVGINVPIPVPMVYYSFGGWKKSAFGDAHVDGCEGIDFVHAAEGRHVAVARPAPPRRQSRFPADQRSDMPRSSVLSVVTSCG